MIGTRFACGFLAAGMVGHGRRPFGLDEGRFGGVHTPKIVRIERT
jgi:hypothetical protein